MGAMLLAASLIWILLLSLLGASGILRWSLESVPDLVIIIGGAGLLYLLPGLALLRLLWREAPLAWPERLALALGIGVALPPLLLQIAYLLGLPWNTLATALYLILSLVVLIVHKPQLEGANASVSRVPGWIAFMLTGLFALGLLVRLYVVRDLSVGMWGDSYHHTMIAQLLIDNAGIFSSWEPYAPLVTFTYHYGFHSNAAFFHWITGIPVTKSVVWVGQLLNAATVAMAYVMTVWLTRSRTAGLWAALLTGFINTQPAYYVNWGRYTQLTGQVILPTVLILWMAALDRKRPDWRSLFLAAVVTACLLLTHYIVAIFTALFLLVYLVALLVRGPCWRVARHLVSVAGIIGALSLLLAAPWILNTLGSYLIRNLSWYVRRGPPANSTAQQIITTSTTLSAIPPFYVKAPLLALAALGFLVALRRRCWRTALLAVWAQLMIVVVVPHVVGMPGSGVINSFTSYIALYLPLLPLAAYALASGQKWLARRQRRFALVLVGASMLVASAWGCTWQGQLIDPKLQLFTAADERAMEWIRTHTPVDARFLVNSFPAYGGSLIAGTDGGWWIPLLTGRQSNLPPITYGSERGALEDYAKGINALAATLRERPLTDPTPVKIDLSRPAALQALREAGIEYIYKGARSNPGPERADSIDLAVLHARPDLFRQVYAEGGVEIFMVINDE